MAPTIRPGASLVHSLWQRVAPTLVPLLLFLACLLPQAGCTCESSPPIPTPRPLLICRPHAASRPAAPPVTPGAATVPAGTIPQSFSITSGGSATLVLPLTAVPGRYRGRLRRPHRSFRGHGGDVGQPRRRSAGHS